MSASCPLTSSSGPESMLGPHWDPYNLLGHLSHQTWSQAKPWHTLSHSPIPWAPATNGVRSCSSSPLYLLLGWEGERRGRKEWSWNVSLPLQLAAFPCLLPLWWFGRAVPYSNSVGGYKLSLYVTLPSCQLHSGYAAFGFLGFVTSMSNTKV